MYTVRCPICGVEVTLTLTVEARLTHTAGNGRKGFITADVGASGIEHTCAKADVNLT